MLMETMLMFRVMVMTMEMIMNTKTVRTDVEEVSHHTIDTSEDDKLGKLRMLTVTIFCLPLSFNILLV